MPKTKAGEKIDWKEFFARWKSGIEGITPYQQTKMQLHSMYIIIIGIICGIVICLFAFKTLWWLFIILVGALFNSIVQLLGTWQKLQVLKKVFVELPEEDEKEEKIIC